MSFTWPAVARLRPEGRRREPECTPNWMHTCRYRADPADKILMGADPDDLPVEQPTKFNSVINSETARALGISEPLFVLLQATLIIHQAWQSYELPRLALVLRSTILTLEARCQKHVNERTWSV